MFEAIKNFFKKISKEEKKDSKDTAKERLHLVLMQDRANVSADFLEMMKQEIIEVIKKYIDVDENSIDVKLTNKVNSDGTTGAPALYANIPIVSLKDDTKKANNETQKEIKNENASNIDTNEKLENEKDSKQDAKEHLQEENKEEQNIENDDIIENTESDNTIQIENEAKKKNEDLKKVEAD